MSNKPSNENNQEVLVITILLIEDSKSDRETYIRYLEQDSSREYNILEAETLQEGIKLWQDEQPDLIFLDLILPDGDGLELLKIMKEKQDSGINVPVVIVTGQGNEQIAAKSIKLGAIDYVHKKDISSQLLNLISDTTTSRLDNLIPTSDNNSNNYCLLSENKIKILMIDDSPIDREVYIRYFNSDQTHIYTYLEAETLKEGYDLWKVERPDVLLIDLSLPDGDGIEFLNKIAPDYPTSILPAIILTGQGDERRAVKAMKEGAADYLVKNDLTPLKLQDTVKAVANKVKSEIRLIRSQQQEQIISDISLRIRRSLNLEDVLSATVREVRGFLNSDRTFIYQLAKENKGFITAESVNQPWQACLGMEIASVDCPLTSLDSYQNGEIYQFNDQLSLAPDNEQYLELLTNFDISSCLIAPIVTCVQNSSEKLWGLLIVNQCSYTRKWEESEISFLKRLSVQIAIAIQQAELYTSLQKEVEQRNHLAQKYLKAKKIAELANNSKSLFIANMSHEIRTPMNGVIGMLDILQKSKLNSQQASYVQIAQSSAQSLLTLINDILDFSKIEAGQLDLEIIDFDLYQEINDFVSSMTLPARQKGLELILDLPYRNDTFVKGDPSRFRQILTNLVGNALKFTEQGEIMIKCRLENLGNDLILHTIVEDTGIGIREEKIDSLFEHFTQVDVSTTRKYGGTGLGLAICKNLCELMGGNIKVQSTIDQGTKIEFTVKLQASEVNPTQATTVSSSLNGLSVLVVEDNDTSRQVLTNQLEAWGVDVTESVDGIKAWNLCKTMNNSSKISQIPSGCLFDVMIIDEQLPMINGLELITLLKADAYFQPIPIILMTHDCHANYSSELEIKYYLSKPFVVTHLLEILTKVSNAKELIRCPQPKPTTTDSSSSTINNRKLDNLSPELHSFRILLVEDNETNEIVVKGLLGLQGLNNITVAKNGIEAIEILSKTSPESSYDLILMDCLMSRMDGYEATKLIRQGEAGIHNQNKPIIAMTANAMRGAQEKCLEAGMSDYISKPITPDILTSKLEKFIDN